MTQIILYLKGERFQEIEFDPLDDEVIKFRSKEYNFKCNVNARTAQLEANIRGLKAMYWKQIQKVGFDSFVVVVFQSKMNNQDIPK